MIFSSNSARKWTRLTFTKTWGAWTLFFDLLYWMWFKVQITTSVSVSLRVAYIFSGMDCSRTYKEFLQVLSGRLRCSRSTAALYYTVFQEQNILINESILRNKISTCKEGPSRPQVSHHLSILYAPTISNTSIMSLNWTHSTGQPCKYQFKLNKIRKGGSSSLLDGILHTDGGVTAGLKWINELTLRGWSKWPWVNTSAAARGLEWAEVLWKRTGHW